MDASAHLGAGFCEQTGGKSAVVLSFLCLEMKEKRKWPKEPVQSISSLGAAVRKFARLVFLASSLSRVFFSLCKVSI